MKDYNVTVEIQREIHLLVNAADKEDARDKALAIASVEDGSAPTYETSKQVLYIEEA